MKLAKRLARSQLKVNRSRTMWTILGIALTAAMITAVSGFAASGLDVVERIWGAVERTAFFISFVGLAVVLSLVIIVLSVIVISNSFRVSAAERTRQFGILKSVGATKKHIASIIMQEGIVLSAIGIPLGAAIGVLVEFIGIRLANYFLTAMNAINTTALNFNFIFAWQAVLISAFAAFVTVLISAWLPARKAARIPAIEAIRQSGEVNIKARQVRTSRLTQRLFGFEGALAAKSMKRSRRNFRATTVSLTISVILFILASAVGMQINQASNLLYPNTDASVVGQWSSQVRYMMLDDQGTRSAPEYLTIAPSTAEAITAKLREFPETGVFAVGCDYYAYTVNLPADLLSEHVDANSVTLVTLDAEHYAALCKVAGVPVGSNILINAMRTEVNGKRAEVKPFKFANQTVTLTANDKSERTLKLDGELTPGEVPYEIQGMIGGFFAVIVPDDASQSYLWYAQTADDVGFTEYAKTVITELAGDTPGANTDAVNVREATAAIRNITNLVMVFIYGFVGMLTLIALTNVVSTISANIRSRAREFAVLKSVGMTQSGLRRMLNLESIMCSVKSVIIGLPLGALLSYFAFRSVNSSIQIGYAFPILAIIESVIGVFLVTWITMRFAASRIKGDSIVAAIRAADGM